MITTPSASSTIYIVDSDAKSRSELTRQFLARGLEVKVFADGESFLKQRRTVPSSCLIIDMNLPNMSGLDVVQQLAGNHSALPIIMMSSNSDVKDAVKAMRAGCLDFIEKPFANQKIVDRVKQILKGRENVL